MSLIVSVVTMCCIIICTVQTLEEVKLCHLALLISGPPNIPPSQLEMEGVSSLSTYVN